MVEVNLFDDTFRQSECSVAWATPQHMRYVRDRMSYQGITFFTEGYVTNGTPKDVRSTYGIGWLHEPQCLHPSNYKINSLHGTNLDLILTHYEPLIGLPGFEFAPYGGVWVNQADWNVYTKTKKVSMLFGSKRQTEGHKIRHEISGDLSHADVDYYGFRGTSVNYSQETKLRVLKDYSFSIVTETCRQNNLFTEILLDCFITGTVPIFWGCPNIGDYFNEGGILSFTHASEVGAIVKNLSPDLYMSMAGAVLDNYYTAQKYAVTEDWIMYNILLGQFL